jgi:uncharacterized SAM-binding protein YcdF (DUF218 family)
VTRVFVALVLIVGALVLWSQRALVLAWVGTLVVEQTPLARADAVVVLVNSPRVAAEAAAIVKAGHAPRVLLFTSPEARPDDEVLARLRLDVLRPHEVTVRVLRASGIAADRITVVPRAPDGTNEAAHDVIRYARTQGITRVIVVTFRSHSRRTAHLLRRGLTAPGAVMVRAAPQDAFDPAAWWHQRVSAIELATEGLRWLNSFVLGDLWGHPDAGGEPGRADQRGGGPSTTWTRSPGRIHRANAALTSSALSDR